MNAKPKAKLMIAVCKTGSILGSLFAKVSGEHSHKLRIWWDLHRLREFFLKVVLFIISKKVVPEENN